MCAVLRAAAGVDGPSEPSRLSAQRQHGPTPSKPHAQHHVPASLLPQPCPPRCPLTCPAGPPAPSPPRGSQIGQLCPCTEPSPRNLVLKSYFLFQEIETPPKIAGTKKAMC